ncbi:MAG: energy-coupling factor transporter ATPase [Oscillospiraceae bacterium]|jgi:energy-coupling factor transport system ATP-binding protein|nr:energy-coupling factor transporter ATPase [Oscillospiraceae bacterium]
MPVVYSAQRGAADAVLRAEGLVFSYKPREGELPPRVLDGVDLSVWRGQLVAVLGHNGSGKSTLARHFNALLAPVCGRVLVDGMDTSDEKLTLDIRRHVGMVFQNPDNQIVASVVEEDVAFAPENLGYPSDEIRARVDGALRTVGMYEYAKHAPHLLSGGQKQRVAIAGVLAMEPKCVVFDEPTAMLDPRGRESVVNIIRSLCDDLGVTVVLITHHMEEAILADRIVVMSEGRVVMDGRPREIFTQPDALQGYGLGVPETVSLLRGLREDGFDVPLGALTADECADAIMTAVGGAVLSGCENGDVAD